MVQPNLLFPINCQIQTLNRDETHYDEDLREVIHSEVMSQTINIPGQPMWTTSSKLDATSFGPSEQSDGYIVFKYFDLKVRNITLKREDRIIKIGHVECDLYVIALQPIAHWSDQNGPGLLKAFFRDKQATRNSPGV